METFQTLLKQPLDALEQILSPATVHANILAQENDKEFYELISHSDSIHLKATSPIVLAFALSELIDSIKTGTTVSLLGRNAPFFPLRPLWIVEPLQENIFVKSYYKAASLGFNAIALEEHSIPKDNVHKELGLKLIVKPNSALFNLSPLDIGYVDNLKKRLAPIFQSNLHADYLFWESPLNRTFFKEKHKREGHLYSDFLLAELKALEAFSNQNKARLIYFPNCSSIEDAHLFTLLSKRAQFSTILAFPSVAGAYWADHLNPNPIWEFIRKSAFLSKAALLPIINCGSVKQGQGLWPILTNDLLEHYLNRAYSGSHLGAMAASSWVSCRGSFLDCNLWSAGKALWRRKSSEELAEEYFSLNCAEFDYLKLREYLRSARGISLKLSRLQYSLENFETSFSEEKHLQILSILAEIKWLEEGLSKDDARLINCFHLFFRDARRILSFFLQSCRLPLPKELHYIDQQESFWSEALVCPGKKLKINLLKTFNKGTEGSALREILNLTILS